MLAELERRAVNGIGGELFVDWPDGPAWIDRHVTGPQGDRRNQRPGGLHARAARRPGARRDRGSERRPARGPSSRVRWWRPRAASRRSPALAPEGRRAAAALHLRVHRRRDDRRGPGAALVADDRPLRPQRTAARRGVRARLGGDRRRGRRRHTLRLQRDAAGERRGRARLCRGCRRCLAASRPARSSMSNLATFRAAMLRDETIRRLLPAVTSVGMSLSELADLTRDGRAAGGGARSAWPRRMDLNRVCVHADEWAFAVDPRRRRARARGARDGLPAGLDAGRQWLLRRPRTSFRTARDFGPHRCPPPCGAMAGRSRAVRPLISRNRPPRSGWATRSWRARFSVLGGANAQARAPGAGRKHDRSSHRRASRGLAARQPFNQSSIVHEETAMYRLDTKLAKIRAGNYAKGDFIIADAKDGDMSNPIPGTGPIRDADGKFVAFPHARRVSRRHHPDRPAGRSWTSCWSRPPTSNCSPRPAPSRAAPSSPRSAPTTPATSGARARTATASSVRRGRSAPPNLKDIAAARLSDLGLYSMTFVNDVDADLRSLEAFSAFREDAAANGIKYFLEVFNPNIETEHSGRSRSASS